MSAPLFLLLLAPAAHYAQTAAPSAKTARQTLPIDPKASTLTWTGHAEVGTYAPSGGLTLREGQITLQNGTLAEARLVVDMKSMTQSNADLLHHLQSADFFDVEHFPVAVIRIDRVEGGTAYGTMTIKDKTAPLAAPVKVNNADGRFIMTGKAALDRTQYGVVYNSPSFFTGLGNKAIRNSFEVEFSLTGAGKLPERYTH